MTSIAVPKQSNWIVRKIIEAMKWFPNVDARAELQHYYIRNARRLQSHKREIAHRIREIVLQLHIRGQQNRHWSKLLSSLNCFPILM